MRKFISKAFFPALLVSLLLTACSSPKDQGQTPTTPQPTAAVSYEEKQPASESEPVPSAQEEPTANPAQMATPPSEEDPSTLLPADSTFNIQFIDVGNADAALVTCDGHSMLIDGGDKDDSDRMYAILKARDISRLDLIAATHAHSDHVGGLPGALNYATAELTLCPVTEYDSDPFRDFKKYADLHGGGITVPKPGDTYPLGSSTVSVLGVNAADGTNNSSLILKIKYGQTSFLFMADAEAEAEQALLASGADLSATVLKVGHHGSDTSTSYSFLQAVNPQYAVVSVGAKNSYGHPAGSVLSLLQDAGVKLYRTDLQGDIDCSSDGMTVTFKTQREADEESLFAGNDTFDAPLLEPVSTPSPVISEQTSTEDNAREYVLNTNTKKFHYPSCTSVKKMKDKNKQVFTGTREDVISMGYDPCGNCCP